MRIETLKNKSTDHVKLKHCMHAVNVTEYIFLNKINRNQTALHVYINKKYFIKICGSDLR